MISASQIMDHIEQIWRHGIGGNVLPVVVISNAPSGRVVVDPGDQKSSKKLDNPMGTSYFLFNYPLAACCRLKGHSSEWPLL